MNKLKKFWFLFLLFPLFTNAFSFVNPLEDIGRDGNVAKYKFTLHESFIPTGLAWSGDGKMLATASMQSNEIHIWGIGQRRIIKELSFPTTPVQEWHSLAWSADGRYVATCMNPSKEFLFRIQIWDTKDWTAINQPLPGSCKTLKFSNDSKFLIVAYGEYSSSRHRSFPVAVAISTDSWSVIQKKSWPSFEFAKINDISFLPGGTVAAFVYGQPNFEYDKNYTMSQGGVLFWDLAKNSESLQDDFMVTNAPPAGSDAISIAINHVTDEVAVGAYSGKGIPGKSYASESVHIFDLRSKLLLAAPFDSKEYGRVYCLAYSADGRYLMSGHTNHSSTAIHIIDTKSHQVIDTLSAQGSVLALAAQNNGPLFAAASGFDVTVWELK